MRKDPGHDDSSENSFTDEQLHDSTFRPVILCLLEGTLPAPELAAKNVAQSPLYTIADGILYFIGQKDSPARTVVPCRPQNGMTEDYQAESWQFFRPKGVYGHVMALVVAENVSSTSAVSAQCAIVAGSGRKQQPNTCG